MTTFATPPGAGSALGAPVERREAREKVTGTARYAFEYTPPGCAYAWPVPASIARGSVVEVDTTAALALPGVLDVLTPTTAPRIAEPDDPTLYVLQNGRVPHRGWYVALAVAETLEAAREAAGAVHVHYAAEPFDVTLSATHPEAYLPDEVNGGFGGGVVWGDPAEAYAAAPVGVDVAYEVPPLHNQAMEPHAATARWDGDRLTVYDSSQGSSPVRDMLAAAFGLAKDDVTVVAEHVGGGFGSKGTPRPQAVLAALAARAVDRPVKLALHRREMAAVVGHRAPTAHRLRLGAKPDGRLLSLEHEVTTHTSRLKEFVEQAAVSARTMYATPNHRTTHRAVALDVPSPSWMRAPGQAPGMYALESAMDELAYALDLDPIELRVRNEPETEPESGRPFSSRHLLECLREGALRFGWDARDPRPGVRHEGALLTGTGVAAATYPVLIAPCRASARAWPDGTYLVQVNATDMGTGARTVLTQVAADALQVALDDVRVDIGSSALPTAPLAGGSSGTGSWGWAVHRACATLRAQVAGFAAPLPPEGLYAAADTREDAEAEQPYARHAFGAHFAEVTVDTDSGEVRTRRLLGVYAAGRILNARTAHSQFVGGMAMGLGMALTERSEMDAAFGDFLERDLAAYHIPSHADVPEIEAHWIEEDDRHLNPMGSKGIGEIGTVGTAAALGNAFYHATGTRMRELPLTPDRVLNALG